VLQKIVPILQQNLVSGDAKTRQGVCQGLAEVMKSGKKSHVVLYLNDLVPAVCSLRPRPRSAGGGWHCLSDPASQYRPTVGSIAAKSSLHGLEVAGNLL
jgi:hypothetical protein